LAYQRTSLIVAEQCDYRTGAICVLRPIKFVPLSKHSVSVIKTSQLMLYREIIAVCSQIHTKHINTLRGQNVELLNVKPGGSYSDHWALKGYI